MKIKKINIPIYKDELWVCITPDVPKAKKWFSKKVTIDNWNEDASAHVWQKKGYIQLMWIRGIKTKDEIATLCHETTHAAWNILDEAGIKLDGENHEALTYLQGYLIRQILK